MKQFSIAILFCLFCINYTNSWCQVYVSPSGSDTASGTVSAPFATVARAFRKVRDLRRLQDPSVKNGAKIILQNGVYTLLEPITLKPEDSGNPVSPTIVEAATGTYPIISGGQRIEGWHKVTSSIKGLPEKAVGKVWEASLPASNIRLSNFRQIWVNGTKAIRARSNTNRILHWNKKDGSCWIPTPKISGLKNVEGLEFFIQQWWEIANLRVKKYEVRGDSTLLRFYEPESAIQNEHPWPAPWISKETGNSAFYLTNSICMLDEPGEWFLDISSRKVYYWPRPTENLAVAEVIAPYLETLVKIEGTIENPVSNISFRDISFQHTGWLRPSNAGHVPHQLGMYMLEAYRLKPPGTASNPTLDNQAWVGRPAAAFSVAYAQQIKIERCSFKHLAMTGVDFKKGTGNSIVRGNLFRDIGGTAIQAGQFSDEATEVHIPYNPSNEKEIAARLEISNNLITNVTNEDWGTAGIAAGYVRDISIHHNEISEVNYSGISLGWGWTAKANAMKNNRVFANKVHHYAKQLYDAAGIYVQSAQPGTVIEKNYIDSIYKAPYAHLPSHWFYLYTDEGAAYMTVKNNWTPSAKFLQNANGAECKWDNNGPQVSDSIKTGAGIQSTYQFLLQHKIAPDTGFTINRDQPVIVEIITDSANPVDLVQLKSILQKNKLTEDALYQWKNHIVIFDKVQDVFSLQEKLRSSFPKATVKTYNDLFYQFDRKQCPDKGSQTNWKHILLTANLVADKKLQNEYLQFHATQFQKWPEVSAGFCNASFQQLLLFRNERQLMLVISVPADETLDHLNPKTTENNPRVNEWNKLMKKYQEGIKGAGKGEAWVFLEKMNTK